MNRIPNSERYDEIDNLSVYIHDGSSSLRFEVEGDLSGNAARKLEQSWCTASSVIGNRSLVIALGSISSIDAIGRNLLRKWSECGAQFVAASSLVRTLVSAIVGRPVKSAMGATHSDGRTLLNVRSVRLIPIFSALFRAAVSAVRFAPASSREWEEYVDAATLRTEQRLHLGKALLWADELPDRLARLRAGEIVISPVDPQNSKRVPSGLIHNWIAAAFIPHATLKDVLNVARDLGRDNGLYRPRVTNSRTLAAGELKDRLTPPLIHNSVFLKNVLDTDYESCHVNVDDRHTYSIFRTARIQESEEFGAAAQYPLQEGEGPGVNWWLFSIARWVERDGGVYLEFESIGLRRKIPDLLRRMVEPIVRRVSRRYLSMSLGKTVDALRLPTEPANGKIMRGNAITLPSGAG
jgi:hypothetical protein